MKTQVLKSDIKRFLKGGGVITVVTALFFGIISESFPHFFIVILLGIFIFISDAYSKGYSIILKEKYLVVTHEFAWWVKDCKLNYDEVWQIDFNVSKRTSFFVFYLNNGKKLKYFHILARQMEHLELIETFKKYNLNIFLVNY